MRVGLEKQGFEEIKETLIETLKGIDGEYIDASELHFKAFNEDYFLIGYFNCEKWLKNNIGVFNAIGIIKDFETEQFGEVSTDLTDSEKVLNMLVYILGQELINEVFDEDLTIKENIENIEG